MDIIEYDGTDFISPNGYFLRHLLFVKNQIHSSCISCKKLSLVEQQTCENDDYSVKIVCERDGDIFGNCDPTEDDLYGWYRYYYNRTTGTFIIEYSPGSTIYYLHFMLYAETNDELENEILDISPNISELMDFLRSGTVTNGIIHFPGLEYDITGVNIHVHFCNLIRRYRYNIEDDSVMIFDDLWNGPTTQFIQNMCKQIARSTLNQFMNHIFPYWVQHDYVTESITICNTRGELCCCAGIPHLFGCRNNNRHPIAIINIPFELESINKIVDLCITFAVFTLKSNTIDKRVSIFIDGEIQRGEITAENCSLRPMVLCEKVIKDKLLQILLPQNLPSEIRDYINQFTLNQNPGSIRRFIWRQDNEVEQLYAETHNDYSRIKKSSKKSSKKTTQLRRSLGAPHFYSNERDSP